MSESYGLIAAAFSAIATALAAFATWRSPLKAAQLAETLRREAEHSRQSDQRKFEIFATLMQERALIGSESSVRALNLIDAIFMDAPVVREAWAKLLNGLNSWNSLPQPLRHGHVADLLSAMAGDIGLSGRLRFDDFSRVYFPEVLAQDRFIRDMERQEALKRVSGLPSAVSNQPAQAPSPWPPPPA